MPANGSPVATLDMNARVHQRRGAFALVVLTAAFAFRPSAVHAQTFGPLLDSEIPLSTETGRNQGVNERKRREFEPIGVPIGPTIAYPEIAGGIGYTSNVIGLESGGDGDFYASLQPSLVVRSRWSRHSLRATAAYDGKRYFDTPAKDEDGYLFKLDGELEVLERSSVVASAMVRRRYEDQTAGSFPVNGGGSIAIDQTQLMMRAAYVNNQLRLTASTDFNDLNYQPTVSTTGQQIDLDFRDRSVFRASTRLEYTFREDNAVFAQGTYRRTDYDLKSPITDRTSDEWRASIGAIADVLPLVRIAGAVGYFHRSYSNPTFKSIGDVNVDLQIDYYLSPVTTISGAFTRQLEESSITDSSGYISTRFGLRADHELRRNIILSAHAERSHNEFKGVDRQDDRWRFGLGTEYRPTRQFEIGFDISYVSRDSDGISAGSDIDEVRSLISVKFHL